VSQEESEHNEVDGMKKGVLSCLNVTRICALKITKCIVCCHILISIAILWHVAHTEATYRRLHVVG